MTDDFATTDEETDVTFNVTNNDNVVLPQPNTVDLNTSLFGRQTSITTDQGKYSVNNSGDVTFEPARDFYGLSTLEYSMNYGFFGLSIGTAIINVTVNGVNDPPTTKDDEEETNEDEAVVIKILANDSDADDGIDPSSIEITDQEGGSFVASPSGEVTFTPTFNFHGNAKAKYRVRDFAGERSNSSDIKVRVRSINDNPIAVDDNAETDEGVAIKIKILDNDYDVDGEIDPSSVVVTLESGGTFVANNKGEVTFTPSPGFNGTASANYSVQDNEGLGSKLATITVVINSVNLPPVATDDLAAMSEDFPPITIRILDNDSDPPPGSLNPASVVITNQINGTFVVNPSGIVTYTPPANFNGAASAKYTVKDNQGAVSNEATITVTVNAVNDPPYFDAIADQRVLKNSGNKTITITGITAGPLETETLTFKASSNDVQIVPNPTIVYNGPATTATLTFKPQPNKSGTVKITVELVDQGSNKFTREFKIDVINVEFTSTPVTIAITGQLYQYDIDITPVQETLTIVATQKPAWTTLTSTGKNEARLSGTPPGNAPLTNPVTLQLKDGATILDQQQFTITINRPPTVSAFSLNTDEDVPLLLNAENFEGAFSDPDNQQLSEVMFTKVPGNGDLKLAGRTLVDGDKVSVTSIGSVSYNPDPNHYGKDTIYWKGSDGYSFSQNAALIDIVIDPINDAPVIEYVETEHLKYELGSEVPKKLTTAIQIRDDDNLTLTGAQIRFDFLNGIYEQGKEILSFRDTLNITGDFNAGAATLILSGTSSVANYQAALRTVKYNYINLDQVNLRTAKLDITIADGETTSDDKSRYIDLIYTFKHLDIPNAFSPNGDRANEWWVITSPNTTDGTVPYTEALIRVYNKRGLLVYEAKGFSKPWDGTYDGRVLPVDTYYYTIDLKYNRVRYKGVVTILR